jgi:sugar-specific transcriptional regulator TrmB
MSPNISETQQSTAIEQLRALGLSAYAARTYVALTRLGGGTAQEVSEASEVPRTRVYDAVDELRDQGLVDVQNASPKQFWPVSTETTARQFDREYTHRVNVLSEALDELSSATGTAEQRGVWTVTGREAVEERVLEFVRTAEREVVYMTVEELLGEPVTDALGSASRRGVSIRLAEMSDSAERTLEETVPGAEPFDSLWHWQDTPAGRLLMIDREKTLVSVLVPGDGEHPPEPHDETAIWGSGRTNGLVVVLQALFTWQLGESDG